MVFAVSVSANREEINLRGILLKTRRLAWLAVFFSFRGVR